MPGFQYRWLSILVCANVISMERMFGRKGANSYSTPRRLSSSHCPLVGLASADVACESINRYQQPFKLGFEYYSVSFGGAMPIVEVHLIEGYTSDDKRRLSESLTDAVRLVVPAPPDAVTVMVHELSHDHYYRGRITRTPAPALAEPCGIIEQFLTLLACRDLAKAREYLAHDVVLQFPNSPPMHTLDELIEWSRPRYRSIEKNIIGIEAFHAEGNETIVFCRGTLSGQWPDGVGFKDVRFIDRFELINAKITRQDVWNDLAEARSA